MIEITISTIFYFEITYKYQNVQYCPRYFTCFTLILYSYFKNCPYLRFHLYFHPIEKGLSADQSPLAIVTFCFKFITGRTPLKEVTRGHGNKLPDDITYQTKAFELLE